MRILATGDGEGQSPSYLCVDEDGDSFWESFGEVQITSLRALPQSARQQTLGKPVGAGYDSSTRDRR